MENVQVRTFDVEFQGLKRDPVVVLKRLTLNKPSGTLQEKRSAKRCLSPSPSCSKYHRLPKVAKGSFCENINGHDPRAQTQILSVLLGVRNKGVPVVELERLDISVMDTHFNASTRPFIATRGQDSNPRNGPHSASGASCDLLSPPRTSRKRKVSKRQHKRQCMSVAVCYRETDSSDDNWSASSLRLWR